MLAILILLVTAETIGVYLKLQPATWIIPILAPRSANATPTPINIGNIPGKGSTGTPTNSTPITTPTSGTGNDPNPIGPGPDGCNEKSPYGFTTPYGDERIFPIYQQMGICWLRFQIHESDMRTGKGTYDWSKLDAVVSMMNRQGIHLDVPIQCFTGDGNSSCFGNPYTPTTQEMTAFASQVAARYNGSNGLYIDAFEIGNEEYDTASNFDIKNYGPLLKAGYQAIKAVHPRAQVGMYGTYVSNPNYSTDLLTAIFQGGYGGYMDFMNLHYYNGGYDPTTSIDSFHPSFDARCQLFHNIAAKYGYPNLELWITETGWPVRSLGGLNVVTPEQQAAYMRYVTEHSANSGFVTRIFWFTVNFGNQPNNIYPPSGPLPAFFTLRDYVKQRPVW